MQSGHASHGYLSGEHFECPKCGNEAEAWSRVVGLLQNKSKIFIFGENRKTSLYWEIQKFLLKIQLAREVVKNY